MVRITGRLRARAGKDVPTRRSTGWPRLKPKLTEALEAKCCGGEGELAGIVRGGPRRAAAPDEGEAAAVMPGGEDELAGMMS